MIIQLLSLLLFAQDPYVSIEQACNKNLTREKVRNAKEVCSCLKRNFLKDVPKEAAQMLLQAEQGKDLGNLPKKIEGSEAYFDYHKDIKAECGKNTAFNNPPEGPPRQN